MSNDWLELVGSKRAACCCKELGVAALRRPHNLTLPVSLLTTLVTLK